MAEIEKTEFEFPDEVEDKNPRKGGRVVEPEDDPEIEIIDDTPADDRNRKPMEEAPKDVTDEELEKYTDQRLKARLAHIGRGYHEERRAKEAAQREKEEAVKFAQSIAAENKKLQGSLSSNQTALVDQAKKVVANELEQAKRKFKEAYESGDADALTSAQEAMTSITMKAERLKNFRPPPLQPVQNKVKTEPFKQEPQKLDTKTQAWTEKNTWFGPNKKMTAYALGLHEELVNDGFSAGSDEYFKRVDTEMRDRFSDVFESEKTGDAPSSPRKSNVVAPATRSTAPRKVVLTRSQVEIAKRLGVPLELYARKVAEEMRK
tara:strand:+ start:2120 stop:3076 length:957 start_codon:yes stop_codon:yes gene_type:complete